MRSESYDDMLAKRRKQENELLGTKPSKKEKTKKEKSKVKKVKSVEDVVKPKAEVKPMVVEEEVAPEEEEVEEVEENVVSETQRESVTSKRSKKKNRKWKNVSFSDEGEPMNGVHMEIEEVKPILVNKDEHTPITPQAEPIVHVRRPGKDSVELKREHEQLNGSENGVSKKKKKKGRVGKTVEEEVIERTNLQQTFSQAPIMPQMHSNQSPIQTSHLPPPPKSVEPVADVEKSPSPVVETSAKKKKKTEKRSEGLKVPKEAPKDANCIGDELQNLIDVVDLTPMNTYELKTMANVLVGKGALGLLEPDESVQAELRNLRASEATLQKELLGERNNLAQVTVSAKERMAGLNAKIMELQQELNRTSAHTQEARQLREENERLKNSLKDMENRMKIITDQFALNASQLDTTERAKKALEVQIERLREQLKNYEKRLHEGSAHLADQLTATKTACATAERDAREARRELESANSALTFERTSAQERVTTLEREITNLQHALQTSKAERRGAAEGQEDPVQRSAAAAGPPSGARSEQLEKASLTTGPPIKEKESKITDLESEVQRLNQQIDSQRHKNNQLENRLTASSERLEVAQQEAEKVSQLTHSLRAKEHEVSMLKSDLEKLNSRVAATDDIKQDLAKKSEEAASLRRENEELRAEQSRQKAASVDDSAVLTCLQAQVDGLRRENELLKNTNVSGDSEKWQTEIDALRTKNNELREKNWKTVEALNAAQTEAERRVKEAQDSAKSECRDLKATIRRLESEATANQGWRGMAEKAENDKREAEDQLAHYKAALVETETILRDLEKSVETEERKWQMTLRESEQECERARKELANAYSELKKTGASREDISDLDFAYRCVEKSLTGIVDEMEEKLETTEETLAEVVRDRDALMEQLAGLQTQLEGASTAATAAAAAGSAEAASLRAELEEERKTKKELAKQNTKFNALVRIGQDALKAEQELVQKLQAQLQAQANGKAQTAS